MKVYLIWQWCGDAWEGRNHLCGVCLTNEKAKEIAAKIDKETVIDEDSDFPIPRDEFYDGDEEKLIEKYGLDVVISAADMYGLIDEYSPCVIEEFEVTE